MFSTTAKAKTSNFGYTPRTILNFHKEGLPVYKSNMSNFTKFKIAHLLLTAVSVYSLIRAYQKNRKIRGILIWTPLTLFSLYMFRAKLMHYKQVASICLQPDGKHVTIGAMGMK